MFRFNRDDEYSDYGPVQYRFDSTQRKKQVIVYNSLKFPGHASEWYFARRNNTTANETYRCVQVSTLEVLEVINIGELKKSKSNYSVSSLPRRVQERHT
jgi:hypothetical protein